MYEQILAIQPQHYWARFSSGNAHERLGNPAEAARAWRLAIECPVDARIGAYHHLLRQEFRDQDFRNAALLDDTLALSQDNSQKRWHYAPLLFLSGVRHLALGDLLAADKGIAEAYEYYRDLDETGLLFKWIGDKLATIPDVAQYPRLAYLLRSSVARRTPMSYPDQLATLQDDTTILEIGAMDGVKFDPLYKFVKERHWSAVLVEPTRGMFDQLQLNYAGFDNVQCIRAAVTDYSGELVMYRIGSDVIDKPGIENWGLSVTSASMHILRFYEDLTVQETVPAMTFDELTQYAGVSHIDVLQIDTEGHDWTVFKQISLDQWKIKLIHIEIRCLDPVERLRVFDALDLAGYTVGFDGHDVTAVKH